MRSYILLLTLFFASAFPVTAQQIINKDKPSNEPVPFGVIDDNARFAERNNDFLFEGCCSFNNLPANMRDENYAPSSALLDSDERYTYEYNAQGVLLTVVSEQKPGSNWVNSERITFEYGADGLLSMILHEQWVDNAWKNSFRTFYSYEPDGKTASIRDESWFGGAWEYSALKTYTYDFERKLVSHAESYWSSGSWQNGWLFTYNYNVSGFLTSKIWQSWQSTVWVDDTRYVYTYDAFGNKLTEKIWVWSSSSWVQTWQGTFTYNASGKMLSELWEQWAHNGDYRITYTYDASGFLTQSLEEYFVNSAWENNLKYVYAYDAFGNGTRAESYAWRTGVWQENEQGDPTIYYNGGTQQLLFSNAAVITVEYSSFVDVTEEPDLPELFSVSETYPNPFNPSAALQYQLPNQSRVIISVFNSAGQIVTELLHAEMSAGQHEITWNAESFASGMYLIRVEAFSAEGKYFTSTKKAVLLK